MVTGIAGQGTGEPSVTPRTCCDATPEVNGPWVGGNVTVRRTNQIAVICHLSSSCTDKPNLLKFFSSNWKTAWPKSRANAFCRVPPSAHDAALPKQPTRFPAIACHVDLSPPLYRLSSCFRHRTSFSWR